jgi:hypothetical protein
MGSSQEWRMEKLLKWFRRWDPMWQALGVILGLVGVVVSTFVAYDIYRKSARQTELVIEEYLSAEPFDWLEMFDGRILVLVDGLEADQVLVFVYGISNEGQSPIRPEDYVEPIRVSMEAPWEIRSVQTEGSSPPGIDLAWTRTATNTYQMEPALLNPGDSVALLILANSSEDVEMSDSPVWTARIANVSSIDVRPFGSAQPRLVPGLLDVTVAHTGWGLYLIGVLAVLFLVVALVVASHSGRLGHFSTPQLVLTILVMVLSVSSSEMIVSVLIKKTRQHWLAWVLAGLHVALIAYTAWPIVRRRLGKPGESTSE